jgi:class 3 adenylate cyclase/predicted ATPase
MAQVCPACGAENPDGFRHCGYCAAALTAPVFERRRLATLVFCDLVGSTALGERVDPEALQELLALYFGEMRLALERHGGVVEKFIGDAVVGVFGVPVAHEDDALRACRAALEMQARLGALNPELERRFGLRVEIRIGVNSGEVVGSRETFVTGDAANVAARLEQTARPGEVLLGEATLRLTQDSVRVDLAGQLNAKGKSEPVTAYRLVEAAVSGPLPRRIGGPLVGRTAELARLGAEFEAISSERRCRLVTVIGEPGVGKSRLVAEFAERSGRRSRTVRGACLSYGEGITYWPVAQIVRELAEIREGDSADLAYGRIAALSAGTRDEAAVSAQILQLLGLGGGATTPEELAWSVRRLLAAAASEVPLIVVLDDIHWAEPALLELLDEMPRLIGETPLLLVCLARPELLEQRPDWPVTIRLEPLVAAEVDSLLEVLEAPAGVRVQIAHSSAGNPLFAEELVAWVRAGGNLDEMPTSLSALLGARLDQLGAEARGVLERGAVEGELFHQDAIVELSEEQTRRSVGYELGQLKRKDVIRLAAASVVAGGVAYQFKHVLVREAAYLATAKKLRAALHQRFAEWLEQVVGDRVVEYHAILGYHLEQAHRYRRELGQNGHDATLLAARAARHLGAAGEQAAARGDYRATANLLDRAIDLGFVDPRERARMQILLGDALYDLGRISEAEATLTAALEGSRSLGATDLATRAVVRREAHRIHLDVGIDPEAVALVATEAIRTSENIDDPSGLVASEELLSLALMKQGQVAACLAIQERALSHAIRAGEVGTFRRLRRLLSLRLCLGPTPVEDAIGRCEELLRSCGDDVTLRAAIERNLAALFSMAARFDEARQLFAQSSRALDELDSMSWSWTARDVSAEGRELAGDFDGAEHDLLRQWHRWRDARGPNAVGAVIASSTLAHLYCDVERWNDAERCLTPSDARPEVAHFRHAAVFRVAAQARVTAHRGDYEVATGLAKRAVQLAEATDYLNARARLWLAFAEVQRAAGRHFESDDAAERALELYDRKGNIAAAARVPHALANMTKRTTLA